jgi:plasmid stabilization system protein ParE
MVNGHKLSRAATSHIEAIVTYTDETFGARQTEA